MKLGILCTMMNGFGKKGYYNTQELGLARALAALGHTVVVYKGEAGIAREEQVLLQEKIRVLYLPLKHIGVHGYIRCGGMEKDLDGLLEFSDQQIFVPHIYRWCRKNQICFVPYVGTAHSEYSDRLRGKITNALFAAGTLRIYRKIPVLAKTEKAREELEKLGVKKSVVQPVGLDEFVLKRDFRKTDRTALRKRYGCAPKDTVICYVARLVEEKRPMEMIDIFQKVRNAKRAKLLIVGDGELRDSLNARIRECCLEKEIRIFPRIPYEKMWEIYVCADYLVNLNREEIFGMSIMEAVYYGVSVAAIKAQGPSVTLEGMEGHRLCNTEEEVAKWLMGPYPAAEVLEKSAQKMIENFTWKRCAAAFADIAASTNQKHTGRNEEKTK